MELSNEIRDAKIRKARGGDVWCRSDEHNRHFEGEFTQGIMTGVRFVHEAPKMTCVAGYESTGEAIGALRAVVNGVLTMPEMARQTRIRYNRKEREFRAIGDDGTEGAKIDTADFLILDGADSIAGWKE